MKKIFSFLIIICCLLLAPSSTYAIIPPEMKMNATPNPVGSGARGLLLLPQMMPHLPRGIPGLCLSPIFQEGILTIPQLSQKKGKSKIYPMIKGILIILTQISYFEN